MDRTIFRLKDIQSAITNINELLKDKTFDTMYSSPVIRAAFERFLEIISEASRHIPEALKEAYPHIRWRSIGDMGNHLRHAYHRIDAELLWNVYENELEGLSEAIDNMIASMRQN